METIAPYLIAGGFALLGILLLGSALTLPVALRSERTAKGFGHSWALARFGVQTEALIGTIIWGLAGLGFIIAAVGYLFGQQVWWIYGAWLGAPLTIIAIALWFGALPMGMYVAGVMASLALGWLVFLNR